MEKSRLDEKGYEVPDPVPMEPPVGYDRQPSLVERIRAMVRSEHLAMEAEKQGFDTFDDADDFDVDDDTFDPDTPYEAEFEPLQNVRERAKAAQQAPPAEQSGPEAGGSESGAEKV